MTTAAPIDRAGQAGRDGHPVLTDLLVPAVDEDGAPFWEYAARGELRVQACADCGRLRFPPRPCCPFCRSFASEWRPVSGRGRIWSFVVVHPPLPPAYRERAPYPVLLVELDEDPSIRMVGDLAAEPPHGAGHGHGHVGNGSGGGRRRRTAHRPPEPRIGAPVRVVFEQPAVPDCPPLPRWALA